MKASLEILPDAPDNIGSRRPMIPGLAPKVGLALVWASVALVWVAFFLPWMAIDVSQPALDPSGGSSLEAAGIPLKLGEALGRVTVQIRRGGETLNAELADLSALPSRLSGAQIPAAVRRSDIRALLAVAEMVRPMPKRVQLKSFLVYLLPVVALLAGAALTAWRSRLRRVAVIAFGCFGVALWGAWRSSDMAAQETLIRWSIEPGLWLSWGGYLGVSLAAVGLLAARRSSVEKLES